MSNGIYMGSNEKKPRFSSSFTMREMIGPCVQRIDVPHENANICCLMFKQSTLVSMGEKTENINLIDIFNTVDLA